MTIAQHAQLNTATDTNQVTFADNGTVTGHADVETYELSGAGANDFTMAATGQNVTGHGGDDVVHTASLTSVTGIIKLDGGTDQLVIETSADINTATLTGVDQINL